MLIQAVSARLSLELPQRASEVTVRVHMLSLVVHMLVTSARVFLKPAAV